MSTPKRMERDRTRVPDPVETYEPQGVDYAWIMQVTFVLTIIAGAPIVAIASIWATLPTWGDRVQFAIGLGAVIWFGIALAVFLYAYTRQ